MKNKVLRYTYILLLVLLSGWMMMCTKKADAIPVSEILSRIAVPVVVFMLAATAMTLSGRKARTVFFILLCALSLFECGVGILQLLGKYAPNNPYHILTGTLVNQGLYGGLMALSCTGCIYEFIRSRKKWIKIASALVGVITLTMLATSVSRAAWLGLIVSTGMIVLRETSFRIDFRRKRNIVLLFIATLAVCAGIFIIKPESALARVHIWRMDCKAICEQPLTGAGCGAEAGAYAKAQEHFFAQKERSDELKQLADSPLFAYNEFLKFGMQGGIPALVLSIAVFVLAAILLWRKKSGFLYLLAAYGVFSLFSFPLFSISLGCIFAVLLADAATEDMPCGQNPGRLARPIIWAAASIAVIIAAAPYASRQVRKMHSRKEWNENLKTNARFGKYYPELRYDSEFNSLYGYELYRTGHYHEALRIFTEGAPFSSDASYYCLLGYCRQIDGDYTGALDNYKKAINTVPSRFTPYYLIINYYKSLGLDPLAGSYKRKALSMPYDTTQSESMYMRKLIEEIPISNKMKPFTK